MELIVSFPNDIEVFSGQLKRFKESIVDPKCSLKIAAAYFCFDNNLSFSSNIKFLKVLEFGLFIFVVT